MMDAFEKRRAVPKRFVGRISTNPTDPGYQNWVGLMSSNYKIEVRINGVVEDYCETIDVESGMIERVAFRFGQPLIKDDKFVLERVKGEVEVRLIGQ